ncbi:MAG: DegT/DnrJ/EryC1/StrS family aminotransferase, partial [Nitrospira sp.]|nr:DegT/DnrJ/EryC1/StrS family aminotransferase [Nitrospira sp.]
GNMGCFSFYPSKNLTVYGDGGMITTPDPALAEKVRLLRDHGRVGKYQHTVLGYNLRFNEIQAAVGRIQLQKLEGFNQRRRTLANFYSKQLKELPIGLPSEQEWAYAVYHLYVIRTSHRDSLAQFLQDRGIQTGLHYPIPCHLQPAMKPFYEQPPILSRTESVVTEILSLPMFPELTEEEVIYITQLVREFLD